MISLLIKNKRTDKEMKIKNILAALICLLILAGCGGSEKSALSAYDGSYIRLTEENVGEYFTVSVSGGGRDYHSGFKTGFKTLTAEGTVSGKEWYCYKDAVLQISVILSYNDDRSFFPGLNFQILTGCVAVGDDGCAEIYISEKVASLCYYARDIALISYKIKPLSGYAVKK